MVQMTSRSSSSAGGSCGSHCTCDSSSDSPRPDSTSASSSVKSLITTTAVKARQSSARLQSMAALAPMTSALLPYAMSVAYVPPFLITSSSTAATKATAMDSDDATAVNTKRAIRQIKNQESANKNRLHLNARLALLMTDVSELKKKEQELQTVVAGPQAENKLLLDQNAFLHSLVISCKQESSSRKENPLDAAASLLLSSPLVMDQSRVELHMLGNGRKKTEGDKIGGDTQVSNMTMMTLRLGKRRTVASTLSATASLTVCSSVFGVTVFTSYDGDAVDSGTIRSVGRVLHESSKSCGMAKCSLEASKSFAALVETTVRSSWHEITSSKLVFGALLNVLSLVAIVLLHRL
uniref:BZIP domain-containing protein n=1 Tax=Peronospora matthiolae TaxID=2874970 RepID=A0AAV1TKX9_9STRA